MMSGSALIYFRGSFAHINPIVTHFFAQSQASGTALFWAIHM